MTNIQDQFLEWLLTRDQFKMHCCDSEREREEALKWTRVANGAMGKAVSVYETTAIVVIKPCLTHFSSIKAIQLISAFN